jgi:hypothetical protein
MAKQTSPLWLSLPALLLVYATFGWLIKAWEVPPNRLVIFAGTTMLVNLMAISPYRLVETLLNGIFGANVRALFVLMASATLVVVMFTWLPIVYYAVLLLVATLLLSMDLQGMGWAKGWNFVTIVICQIVGLGIGFGCNIFWWRAFQYWQHLLPA